MLYHLIGGTVLFYLGTLFFLNLIPHVTVKHLGWFSVNHIYVDLGKTTMYIKSVRLSLNWVRGRDSILKLFRLEIHDINFKCRKPRQKKNSTKSKIADLETGDSKSSKSPSSPDSKSADSDSTSDSVLSFTLPKWIFERIMKYKLTNKINVHVFRCSIYHRATHELLSMYIDYGRLEVSLSRDGLARAAVSIVNGQIQDAQHSRDEVKVFRNIEFEVTSSLVMSCPFDRPTKVDVTLNNFKTSLSIAQLNVPIERILEEKKNKKAEREKNAQSHPEIEKAPLTTLEPQIALLSKLFPVFTSFNFTLEDFRFFYYDIEFTASNFVVNAARESSDERPDKLDITAFLTSFKVLHSQNKCVDLPSATFKSFTDPVSLIKAVDAVLFNKENTEDYIDWETGLSLTNPTVHFYYDQIDALLNRQVKPEVVPKKTHPKPISAPFDPTPLLERLRQLSVRLVILSFKLDVVLPPIGGTLEGFNRFSKDNLIVSHTISSLINTYSTKNFGKDTKRKKFKFNTLFRLKSLRATFMDNIGHISKVTLLCTYNIKEGTLAVRINSKIIKIHSVNEAIFYLVRRIRTNENKRYNKKYEQLKKTRNEQSDRPALASVAEENGIAESEKADLHHTATNELNLDSEKRRVSEEIQQTEIAETDEESNGSTELKEREISAEEQQAIDSYINLFEIVPKFVHHIQVRVSAIEADILCKDGLPSYIVKDDQGNDVDLADFKRGICIRIVSPNLVYKRAKEELNFTIKTVTLYTVSDCFQEYIDDFDDVTNYQQKNSDQSDLSSLDTTFSDISTESNLDEDGSETKKIKKVFNVHDISIGNRNKDSAHKDVNKLVISIPDIDARIDMFFFWCIFYAHTLLKYFEPTVQKACSKEVMNKLDKGPKKTLKLDVQISAVAAVLRLPNNVDVMLEVDSLQLLKCFANRSITIKYIRLYVIHPATKLWTRLLVITEPSILLNIQPDISDSTFEIVSTAVRLNIPHQFLFYTVIDNILTLAKALKQIGQNFKNLSIQKHDFSRIMPEEKPAISLPHISVKTKTFGMTLENDPLETQLQYIYQVGLIEQQQRMKLQKAFDKKEKEILDAADPDIEDKIELTNSRPSAHARRPLTTEARNGSSPHHSRTPSGTKTSNPLKRMFSEQGVATFANAFKDKHKPESEVVEEDETPKRLSRREAEEKVKKARDRLHREFSTSWIRKVRLFNDAKYKECQIKSEAVWGIDEIQPIISDKFDILNYSSGPPALGGCFKNLDLLIRKTEIPDIDKFLHDLGGGQPKLIYTILVPIYARLRASSLYMIIKDYPLPFISFPDNLDPENPTIDLSGNLVVHEMLVTTMEEMRYIFVPFSPAAPSGNYADNFYSTYVPRTLTPVKFTGDMTCNLTTPRACMVNWNKSYQAALSVVTAAFDNFTKPEVDDSPIGWWDKISLIAHGTIKFNVKNELCFHLKSSMNPYEVTGRSAGFVFAWKNDVCLSVNSTGDSRNLVRVESKDFKLGIPNYSASERNSWSLFTERPSNAADISEDDSKKYLKTVVQLSSDEKVVWIFGMMFERNIDTTSTRLCDQIERTDQFKNHWDIRITNPCFDSHEDSYPGFRSDYIHMSLTVVAESKNGKASNAAYFTPFTFQYFFYWWNTLSDGVSMPVKQGKLFKSDSPKKVSSIKTGPHLMTMKYLLVFEPLTIAHTYMHGSDEKLNGQSRVLFTGMKGKFKRISIDLRQRKELVTYINERLGINNQILHLKMNAGEVNVDEADIRFVKAIFSTPSLRGWLVKTMTHMIEKKNVEGDEENDAEFDWNNRTEAFDEWIDNVNEFDEDLSWVDLDDFVELEIAEKLSPNPKVIVIPFCYTPKFSYYRDFSLHEEGPYPFGNEKIALYDVSTISPDEAQANLLKDRIKTVKGELKQNQVLLKNMEAKAGEYPKSDVERVKKELKQKQARLETVESMWEDFSGSSISSNSSLFSGAGPGSRSGSVAGLNRHTSRSLSIYSSHATSFEQDEASRIDPAATKFHNRFIVHNIQIKWDNNLRGNFMVYMQNISDRRSHVYFMSKKAVDLVESVVNAGLSDDEPKENLRDEIFTNESRNGEEIVENFNSELSKLANEKDEEVVNQYLIKLIHPQIQLVSEKDVESCVLVTSRDLEIKIVNVTTKGLNQIISESSQVSGTIESRYGVLFGDSHIFVFKKDESTIAHPQIQYGTGHFNSDVNWPPWVEPEVCYDSSWAQNQLVAERNTMALIYKKPNYLYAEKKSIPQGNEIVVHLAKIVINTSSEQYTTLYHVVTDLLVHNKTHRDEVLNRLDKIVSLSDDSDFQGLDVKVQGLQDSIRAFRAVLFKFERYVLKSSPQVKHEVARLKIEVEKRRFELDVIMRGLGLRSSKTKQHKQDARLWSIAADQLIWHILDNKREPFVDFAMANTSFRRVDSFDGSNSNKFEVGMIQGFNLQDDAVYPELLRPLLSDAVIAETGKGKAKSCAEHNPIIAMHWQMLEAIGGISIMQKAKLRVEPLKVGLDYHTAKQLYEFLFPKDDESVELHDSLKEQIMTQLHLEEDELADATSRLTKSRNPFKELLRKSNRNLGDSGTESDSLSSARRSATLSSKMSASDNSSSTPEGKSRGVSSKRSGSDKSSSTGEKSKASSDMVSGSTKKSSTKSKEKPKESGDDISIIIDRSSKYISIVNIEVEKFSLNVSFKAPLRLKILNVHELNLEIPTLKYKDKMWSAEDLTNRIKKDLIKIILHHSGKIIGNKLKRGRRRVVTEPLKQIQDYASFMTIQDLQKEGRSRDAAKTNSLDHTHPQPHLHRNGHHHEHHKPQLPRSTSETLENYLEDVDEESSDENDLLAQLSGTTGLSEATETTVGDKSAT